MSTITMPHSKEEYARELAQRHFAVEPGMKRIFRLLKPGEDEQDLHEPLKLLEVDEETVAAGVQPLGFGAHTAQGRSYPPVVVIVVTPDEYEKLKRNELVLPNGWEIGHELAR